MYKKRTQHSKYSQNNSCCESGHPQSCKLRTTKGRESLLVSYKYLNKSFFPENFVTLNTCKDRGRICVVRRGLHESNRLEVSSNFVTLDTGMGLLPICK